MSTAGKKEFHRSQQPGVETNWHKVVAEGIAPLISVFSSDPQHEKLAAPTLRRSAILDLWTYGSNAELSDRLFVHGLYLKHQHDDDEPGTRFTRASA